MSFGFAVGDFIEVGKLLYNIIDALRGAKSEYQELVRELESLRQALDHVDKLKGSPSQALTIDSIKLATLTCRHPLEELQAKIVKHGKGLGLGKSEGRLKDARHRVQWGLGGGRNSEVNRLRNYLNVHLNIINMLLLKQGLEQLDIASEQRQTNQNSLEKSIKDSLQDLRDVRQNVEEQALAVRENKTILQTLLNMVGGHIDAPLKALTGVVTKVCVSTQQIYNIVLEIRENTRGIDTRFAYFQTPVQVEDVLGRIFPFPAEFSILTLEADILNRFKQGPGQSEVAAGSYEIFNSQNTNELLEASAGSILRPGMSVSMSVIIESKVKEENRCPVAHCQSSDIIGIHGGKRCVGCDFWFKSGGKKRKSLVDPECNSHHFDERKRSKPTGSLPKLQELGSTTETILEGSHGDLDSFSVFKRVSFVQGPAGPERTNYFQDSDPKQFNEEQNRPSSSLYFHHWQPPAISNSMLRRQSVARTNADFKRVSFIQGPAGPERTNYFQDSDPKLFNEKQNRPSSPLYFHHWQPPERS